MASPIEESLRAAARSFWHERDLASGRQVATGRIDAGFRGAVTAGNHLNDIRDLLADVFLAQLPSADVRRSRGITLPGYYRSTKQWDLLVVYQGHLVAAIELKSQVGPSFGNNFNNRTEEAIGNAVDVWRAYEEGTFGSLRPWLGYVFLLEETEKSTQPVSLAESLYPAEPVFIGTSYKQRYSILCDRLVKERLYDAAWFFTATRDGLVDQPEVGLNLTNFVAAAQGRCAYVRGLADQGAGVGPDS